METATAPEIVAPAETVAPVVTETLKVETAAAPTAEDFKKLTPKQQADVQREVEKIRRAPKVAPVVVAEVKKEEPVAEVAAETATETETATEEKKETAPTEKEEGEEPTDGKPTQFRLRGKTQKENDVLALMRGGRTLEEAYQIVNGSTLAKAEDAPAKEEPPIEAAFDTQISAIRTEIEDLEKKQDAAAAEADVAGALKIQRQITAKEREIENKEMAKNLAVSQQKKAVAETAEAAEKRIIREDYDEVIRDFPELADENSEVRKKYELFVENLREQAKDSPRIAGKLAALTWRSITAHAFAADEGLRPKSRRMAFEPPAVKAKPAPVKTAPPAAVKTASQATAAKALTTKDAPSDQTFELTPEQAANDFKNLTSKQQAEVMRELDKMRAKQKHAA